MGKRKKGATVQKTVRKPGSAIRPKGAFARLIEWAGRRIWLVATALFALSFAVRLLLSFWSGPMVQIVYPDETRFFDIARSLAENGEILVRGIPASFQKILYPLLITPAFLVSGDQIAQMDIIRTINCLLVSSTVFPVLMLAKRLTPNRTVALAALLVTVTLPDMAYSATLMSESLYMPLCLWLFYFASCALSEQEQIKRLIYFAALGFAAYLVYFTKEIGAAFVVAACLLLVFDTIRSNRWQGPRRARDQNTLPAQTQNKLPPRDQNALSALAQNAFSALALLAAFFGAFLVLKLTLFQGMGNTYALDTNDHLALSALSSPSVFLYLAYSAIVLSIAAILSFYAAPALLTAYGYGSMDESNKKTFLFTALSFLVMAGAIAYTLSIREDLGEPIPRLHMRFFAPLVIPLMIQCLDFLFSKNNPMSGKPLSKAFLAAVAVFCAAAIALIPSGSSTGYLMDHFTLKAAYAVESFMFPVGPFTVNTLFMLFKIFLVALAVLCIYLVVRKKKAVPVIAMLLCSVLLINAFDNFMSYTSIRRLKTADFSMSGAYDPDATHLELAFSAEAKEFAYDIVGALVSTNERLRSLGGTAIVFMHPELAPYTDTYLDQRAFPVQPGELYALAVLNGGQVRLADQPVWEGNRYNSNYLNLNTWKRGLLTADYIVTLSTPEESHPFLNVEIVYENWPFAILRNLDPSVIHIEL